MLGLVVCGWLFLAGYHSVVKLSDCELKDDLQNGPGYVSLKGGLEEHEVANFQETGAILKPWFFFIAIGPNYEDILTVRRSRWGGEFRLLSVDLRSRSDGEVFREDLGRVDDVCWATLTRYVEERPSASHIAFVDEGEGD